MASASTSNPVKKPFAAKKEVNVVYGARTCTKKNDHTFVNVVRISNPTPTPRPSANHQCFETPRRQFTRIGMSLSQYLQHMLKANLVKLHDPPANPDTSSPKYNPNSKCSYHSSIPGHETDQCWALKNKIQDLIDNKTIEFDPPPMPKHDKSVNAVEDTIFLPLLKN